MFNWFKKLDSSNSENTNNISALTEEEEKLLLSKIKNDYKLVSDITSDKEKATIFERIGLTYEKMNRIDDAIEVLEKSMECKLSMGDGYKKLLSLYNLKRAEAARNRDDAKIDYYMMKMDEMRNIAKKLTLSK